MLRRTFLKHVGGGSLGAATLGYLPSYPLTAARAGYDSYSPESQGVSSAGLLKFFDAVDASGLEFHSIMINRHGKTLLEGWWEPFRKEYVHALYSLSKSFTATAIGMLHDDGKLSVEDKVITFFPDKLPTTVSDHLAAMRIYDLLTMHTGHDEDTMGRISSEGDDWVKRFLSLDVPQPPGSYFLYNTGATYMLSAIAQQVSGQRLIDFLQPRLWEPLGIVGADWQEDPRGINYGGFGLRVRTPDILNFGQMYLQQGQWKGEPLLSAEWVSEATQKQVDSQDNDGDWGQGYGYQFWRCTPGGYRGDGAYGQYCIVLPDQDAVIAITSETQDMGASMQLVWDHILPAMQDAPALPEDKQAYEALMQRAEQLTLPVKKGVATRTMASKVDQRTYAFEDNDFRAKSVSFRFRDNECEMVLAEGNQTISITSGQSRWITADNEKAGDTLFAIPGRTPMPTKVASYYYWTNPQTLVMKLKYVENAHHDVFTFSFTDQELTLAFDNSLSYQSDEGDRRATLTARLS